MKAIDFINKVREIVGFNMETEIAFIFKEDDGHFRQCHAVKEIFGNLVSEVDNTIIVELEK